MGAIPTAMAYRGSINDIWHRQGVAVQRGWTLDEWAANSGLSFNAVKVPAFADLSSIAGKLAGLADVHYGMARVEERHFIVRNDTGHVLSPNAVSDRYQLVQPREVLDWFDRYIAVDPRFSLDVAGCLWNGATIWATATFNGDLEVAGDAHSARLLMTTTFDGSGSTINRGCMTRVVCQNTMDAALSEGKAGGVVRTVHSAKFDADRVGRELADLAKQFDSYRAMGEAMADQHFEKADAVFFLRRVLDISDQAGKAADGTLEGISARKFGQFESLWNAYQVGVKSEELKPLTAWSLLQGVSRYADHDRAVRGDALSSRFATSVVDSSGAGARLKAKAVAMLDDMTDGAILAAVAARTATSGQRRDRTDDAADMAAVLAQPFKPTRG